jgi:hypothetical protein
VLPFFFWRGILLRARAGVKSLPLSFARELLTDDCQLFPL